MNVEPVHTSYMHSVYPGIDILSLYTLYMIIEPVHTSYMHSAYPGIDILSLYRRPIDYKTCTIRYKFNEYT